MLLNRLIDHTLLTPNAMDTAYEDLLQAAVTHDFYAVCVAPHVAEFAVAGLKDYPNTKVCSVVAFPHGNVPVRWKIDQASYLIDKGVHEIDWVLNCGDVFDERWETIRQEMMHMSNLCGANKVVSKVIVESGTIVHKRLLTRLFQTVRDTGVNFIKTSTGFNGPGAAVRDVRLWNELRDGAEYPKIKASGGIKTPEQALAMVKAGADRLGMSSSVDVMEKWIQS